MPTEFGPFTFDTARHQLLRGDAEIHLSRKAFCLLELLLAERPNVVSKEELHRRIWCDVFVTDSTLNSVVAEVRSALGEEAHASHYIRTVHGVGYAFGGEAREREPRSAPAVAIDPQWLAYGERRLALRPGDNTIGRDRDADVCIEHPSVSRRHARIMVAGDRTDIEDLGSKNGTFVEGARAVGPTPLCDGDHVLVGTVVLTYRSVAEPASTASVSRPPDDDPEPTP